MIHDHAMPATSRWPLAASPAATARCSAMSISSASARSRASHGSWSAAAQVRLGGLDELQQHREMRGFGGGALARLVEALAGVLADRLQHPVAGRRAVGLRDRHHDRLVDQRREQLEHLRTRPRRHRPAPRPRPWRRRRRPRAGGPPRVPARSSRSQLQSTTARRVWWRGRAVRAPEVSSRNRSSRRAAISAGDSVRSRAAASSIGSGWPSSRRQISAHGRRHVRGEGEPRTHGGGAVGEQPHGVGRGERVDGVQHLARDAERLPARGQHAQAGAGVQQRLGEHRDRVDEVLAVVQHQRDAAPGQRARSAAPSCRARGPRPGGRRRSGSPTAASTAAGSWWASVSAASSATRGLGGAVGDRLPRQPGLARAAGPGERDEPGGGEQLADPSHVAVPTDEAGQAPGAGAGRRTATGGTAQHGEPGLLELGARVDAQVLDQPAAGPVQHARARRPGGRRRAAPGPAARRWSRAAARHRAGR